jgi:hypothetical protein
MIYDEHYADCYLRLSKPEKRCVAMMYDGSNLLDILAFHHSISVFKTFDPKTKEVEYAPMVPSEEDQNTSYELKPGEWVVIKTWLKRPVAYKVWGGTDQFKKEFRFLWKGKQK